MIEPPFPGPWSATSGAVRIVRRPEGEAPEWVRDAWIGLELALVVDSPVTTYGVGVLAPRMTYWGWWWQRLTGRLETKTGYIVDANDAVRRLERTNPTAAIWWRTHAGHIVQPGGQFIFDLPACEKIRGA